MLSRRYLMIVALGTLALIMISAVWAKDVAPRGAVEARDVLLAEATPKLVVSMAVARDGEWATYSINLRNVGEVDIKDIFIAGAIAQGTTFVGAGDNPAIGWFRGVEGGNAVFLSGGVPAMGWGGPFVYKVKLSGDAADQVWAWVHWRSPGDGTSISAPIRVLPSVTVALLASGPAGVLPKEPLIWGVREALFPSQSVGAGQRTDNARVLYQLEGTSSFIQDGIIISYGPGSYGFVKGGGGLRANDNKGDMPARRLVFSYETQGQRAESPAFTNAHLFLSQDLQGLKDGPYNLLLIQAEFQPGGVATPHWHPGPGAIYVLEGTLTHTERGATHTYGPGSFWVEETGEPNTTKNIGNTMAKVIAAFLIPEGEAPATFLEEPHPWLFR